MAVLKMYDDDLTYEIDLLDGVFRVLEHEWAPSDDTLIALRGQSDTVREIMPLVATNTTANDVPSASNDIVQLLELARLYIAESWRDNAVWLEYWAEGTHGTRRLIKGGYLQRVSSQGASQFLDQGGARANLVLDLQPEHESLSTLTAGADITGGMWFPARGSPTYSDDYLATGDSVKVTGTTAGYGVVIATTGNRPGLIKSMNFTGLNWAPGTSDVLNSVWFGIKPYIHDSATSSDFEHRWSLATAQLPTPINTHSTVDSGTYLSSGVINNSSTLANTFFCDFTDIFTGGEDFTHFFGTYRVLLEAVMSRAGGGTIELQFQHGFHWDTLNSNESVFVPVTASGIRYVIDLGSITIPGFQVAGGTGGVAPITPLLGNNYQFNLKSYQLEASSSITAQWHSLSLMPEPFLRVDNGNLGWSSGVLLDTDIGQRVPGQWSAISTRDDVPSRARHEITGDVRVPQAGGIGIPMAFTTDSASGAMKWGWTFHLFGFKARIASVSEGWRDNG